MGKVSDPPAGVLGGNVSVHGRNFPCTLVGVNAPPCFVVQEQPKESLYPHAECPDAVVCLLPFRPTEQVFPVFLLYLKGVGLHFGLKVFPYFDGFKLKGNVRACVKNALRMHAKEDVRDALQVVPSVHGVQVPGPDDELGKGSVHFANIP